MAPTVRKGGSQNPDWWLKEPRNNQPREIYIGCRQQETVAENNNNRMLHSKKENEMYADLDEILQWAENNYIDVYMPIISRKEYKMMDRALRLI